MTLTTAQRESTATYALATRLLVAARVSGGGTFAPDGRTPTRGYAVGGRVPSLVIGHDVWSVANPTVTRTIIGWLEGRTTAHDTVGCWVDTDGKLYVDVVDVVPDELEALRLAGYRHEIAVWDFAHEAELRVCRTCNGSGTISEPYQHITAPCFVCWNRPGVEPL